MTEMDQLATIVLLIDPDARHRATAAQLLKSGGCSVVAVRNASEAIETFDAHHADIALIIADDEVVRPEVASEDAAALLPEIKRIDARVPVLVMADAAWVRHDRYGAIELAGVLSKPLQADELSLVLSCGAKPSSTGLGAMEAPDWQFPVPPPVATISPVAATKAMAAIDAAAVPRTARRRAHVTRSQRLIATAAATLVALAVTTWLEVRGGAAPQLPAPVPPPSVEVPAPQPHDIRQAISPASLGAKRPAVTRRPTTRPPAHRKSRASRVAQSSRPTITTTRTAQPRPSARTTEAGPSLETEAEARAEAEGETEVEAGAPQPARARGMISFVRGVPRLCAKPFAAFWKRLRDAGDDDRELERELERDREAPAPIAVADAVDADAGAF